MGDRDARSRDAASGACSPSRLWRRGYRPAPAAPIRTIVHEVLAALDTEFEALYEGIGRSVGCDAGAIAACLTVAGILLCALQSVS